MNEDVRQAMEAAHYLVENLADIFPVFFSVFAMIGGIGIALRLGNFLVEKIEMSAGMDTPTPQGEKPKNDWSDEKPKNDFEAWGDEKPKRVVLNEDGEFEGFE